MAIWSKIVDFFLYSNVWIAAAAASLYIFSNYTITHSLALDNTSVFVFLTCVWLYSLHRYIGLSKVVAIDIEDRFYKIKEMKMFTIGFGVLGLILSVRLAFTLTWNQILVMIIPGLLSMFYVLPIFKNSKRLRDFSYIKIFIIALVWAGLTVGLPLANCTECLALEAPYWLFIERFIFIFAITLPFDIRDLEIDAKQNVKTISAALGTQFTWILCFLLLSICTLIIGYLSYYGLLPEHLFWIHFATNLLTSIVILIAFWKKHDWYYTGLLDGTMFLPLVFLVSG